MIATAKRAEITPDIDVNGREDTFDATGDPSGLFLACVASVAAALR